MKDSKALVSLFNEPLFKEYEMGPYPFRTRDAIKYIKNSTELRKKKQAFIYGAFLRKELIAIVSLHNVSWPHKGAELFYWIRRDLRKKGYGYKAVSSLLGLGFNEYNLHRIEAKMRADNTPSIELAEKLGFKLEARMREKYFNNSRYYDALQYALLKSDFNKTAQS
jgi:RimJ/RimL family protein N-acetyltransferase